MPQLKAIAAMSLNRVIGRGNDIPWHIPEDFKWVKSATSGHIIVMGRKTYDSIGRPLPNRENIVLSRSMEPVDGIRIIRDLSELKILQTDKIVWIFGGAEIYRMALPSCTDLFLTVVKRKVEGDTLFPEFEDCFEFKETIRVEEEFETRHYVNLSPQDL